jgi:hypothetical protein
VIYLVIEGRGKALMSYEYVPRNDHHNTRDVLCRSLYLPHVSVATDQPQAEHYNTLTEKRRLLYIMLIMFKP